MYTFLNFHATGYAFGALFYHRVHGGKRFFTHLRHSPGQVPPPRAISCSLLCLHLQPTNCLCKLLCLRFQIALHWHVNLKNRVALTQNMTIFVTYTVTKFSPFLFVTTLNL